MSILNNIRIVLCDTTHPGNIGSVARAMKTMGITNLILVNPQTTIDDHTLALACNARDVVINAKIVDDLTQALVGSSLAFATTSRRREHNQHLQTPKEAINEIIAFADNHQQVAIVFGCERSGLNTHQVELCNRLLTIPGNPNYFSLNLANAVQIICYEIFCATNGEINHLKADVELAPFETIQGVINNLTDILPKINYANRPTTARNLQNIVKKANLTIDEADLLRGILNKINKQL